MENLGNRTKKFGLNCLKSVRGIKVDYQYRHITDQLLRSSSSVGANYCEVSDAISKKDLYHRLHICRKEAKESVYWLEMLHELYPQTNLQDLINEASQLNKILSAMLLRLNSNSKERYYS